MAAAGIGPPAREPPRPDAPALQDSRTPSRRRAGEDRKDVNDANSLIAIIKSTPPGHSVALQIWSQGLKKLADVKVSERPADLYQPPQQQSP